MKAIIGMGPHVFHWQVVPHPLYQTPWMLASAPAIVFFMPSYTYKAFARYST